MTSARHPIPAINRNSPKPPLANALEQTRYPLRVHGRYYSAADPTTKRVTLNGKVDYEKVKAAAFYQRGIERLHTAFLQQQSVVLMCSEGKPEECHRCKLIGARRSRKQNIPVIHIDENGEQVTQEQSR